MNLDGITGAITNEVLLFILVILMLLFGANGIVGIYQKYIDNKKNKQAGTIDEKRLDFEIDKFSVETIQKAVISLNSDLERVRTELGAVQIELAHERAGRIEGMNKNAAMIRYIAKSISLARQNGHGVPPVDISDQPIIPEVVALTQS